MFVPKCIRAGRLAVLQDDLLRGLALLVEGEKLLAATHGTDSSLMKDVTDAITRTRLEIEQQRVAALGIQ